MRNVAYRLRALLAVAVVGVVMAGCNGEEESGPAQPQAEDVQLPLQQTSNLREAAREAGCEIITTNVENRDHADRQFEPSDYETNPPTAGAHHPEWAEDGVYEPGETPDLGRLVHSLEHGRIHVQYAPGATDATVEQLEALVAETDGYHMLLYENPTGMDYQVAATAWNRLLGCPEMNDRVFDAIRTFRTRFVDQAPERVP